MIEFKQTDPILYKTIQTDGCLFMDLIDIACEVLNKSISPFDVNLVHDYVIPKFMIDNKHIAKDRCYVLDHESIIQAASHVLGGGNLGIKYLYR